MRSMAHPEYKRTHWTPERRKAASERAKAAWREKRAAEERRAQMRKASPIAKTGEEIARLQREMNEIARRWHVMNARKEALSDALVKMTAAFDILEKEGCAEWLTWLND